MSTGEIAITDIAPSHKENHSLREVKAGSLPRAKDESDGIKLGHFTANGGYDGRAGGLVGLTKQKFLLSTR